MADAFLTMNPVRQKSQVRVGDLPALSSEVSRKDGGELGSWSQASTSEVFHQRRP